MSRYFFLTSKNQIIINNHKIWKRWILYISRDQFERFYRNKPIRNMKFYVCCIWFSEKLFTWHNIHDFFFQPFPYTIRKCNLITGLVYHCPKTESSFTLECTDKLEWFYWYMQSKLIYWPTFPSVASRIRGSKCLSNSEIFMAETYRYTIIL